MTKPPAAVGMTKKKRRPPAKLCGAKKTDGSGDTCCHSAGWGTDHNGTGRCKWHGGATPTHAKAAERDAAEQAVKTYGLPRDIDPHDALREEIARTAGHIDWLRYRIEATDPDALTYGIHHDSADTAGTAEGQAARKKVERRAGVAVLVQMYWHERRHFVAVCVAAIRAGIEEREVRITERLGVMVAQVIRGIAAETGIDARPDFPKIVRRHLALVDGGKTA